MKAMKRSMLVLCVLNGFAAAAAPSELNELTKLEVNPTATGAQVLITGSRAPVFTVFRLNDPDRLVVDVTNAKTDAIRGHHEGASVVSGIVASQFSDANAQVGRVLIGLERASKYDVHAEGNALIVSVDGESTTNAPAAQAPAAAAAPAVVAQAPEADVPATAPVVEEKPAKVANAEGVVASRVDEKPVKKPATKLQGMSWSNSALRLTTDGEIAKFELIELDNPPRLAIDVFGVKGSARAPKVSGALVKEVRVGSYADKVRIVLESTGELPAYRTARKANGLVVTMSAPVAEAQSPTEPMEVEIDGQRVVAPAAPSAVAAANAPAGEVAEVKGVTFNEAANGGKVDIRLTAAAAWKIETPDPRSAVLTLERTKIAKSLERSLDTSDLETPVKMVSTFAAPGGENRVRIVVASAEPIDSQIERRADGVTWRFSTKGTKNEAVVTEQQTAGFAAEAETVAEQGAPQQRRYVGKKVSFEFKDIDIHNLLRIIAEISKKNVVVADDVNGRITIRLRNVPWDQALELILRSKSLGKEEFGNIVRVAPLATLEAEERSRSARKTEQEKNKALSVQLIPVNYASASDMATRVKEVLSPRGNVTVDGRTSTLIVRDLPDNMARVRSIVSSLDTQTPQVLIEARMVEATTTFARQIGIQWGGTAFMSAGTGNPTGLVFPNSIGIVGAQSATAIGQVAAPNYAVSLPVGAEGTGGAVGLTFGSAGGAVQLNLRLTAFETQGAIRTISAPRVTTLDNATATISQGVSVPYSQVSAAGANTAFIEARLSLSVTPHVTQDGSVIMQINASNNQPDQGNAGSNGQPGIARKEATTNVLVKDGDTTVIGGIYVRSGSANQAGVPILSKIPVIGFFFRNYREQESRAEELIFISPRILNRQAVAQSL